MAADSVKNKKWQDNFEALAAFRLKYGRWPVYDRNAPESEESKSGNFASVQRKNYRNGSLEDSHFDQLMAVGFNFGGKEDSWQERFLAVKAVLAEKMSVSVAVIGEANYAWLRNNRSKFLDGELSPRQMTAIGELELQAFFPSWEEEFELVRDWIAGHGKLPTRAAYREGHSWLMSQRTRFRNGALSPEQVKAVMDTGFELEPNGLEVNAETWRTHFEAYKAFLVESMNGSVTRHPPEIYTWVQTQRAVFKGNMPRRNALEGWKIEALNGIGFKWSQAEILAEQWTEKFSALKVFLLEGGPQALLNGGQTKSYYAWLRNQQKRHKAGTLADADFLRLKSIGFDADGAGVMASFADDWRELLLGTALELSQSDFDEEVDRLNLLVATDQTGEATRRMEHYQQQLRLFGGAETAECAFCGCFYPRALMAAAHIKARSRCTEAERLDLNVMVPACKFGCDELFEKGYFTVREGFIMVNRDLPSSPALEKKLAVLEGRRTPYFLEKRRKYFEAHRDYHLHKKQNG